MIRLYATKDDQRIYVASSYLELARLGDKLLKHEILDVSLLSPDLSAASLLARGLWVGRTDECDKYSTQVLLLAAHMMRKKAYVIDSRYKICYMIEMPDAVDLYKNGWYVDGISNNYEREWGELNG